MTMYFRSGQILFSGGAVAMSSACCCTDCSTACTRIPAINYCTQCATGDFPTSYSTPGDWQIDISGITVGNNTSCGLCGVASHTGFFNRSIVRSPCSGGYLDKECVWICKLTKKDINNGTFYDEHVLELNALSVSAGDSAWHGAVSLASYVITANTSVGATPDCSLLGWNAQGDPVSGSLPAYEVCRSVFQQNFSRTPPTYKQYTYYPDTCPVECDNPIGDVYGACYPSGWALTAGTASFNWRMGAATNPSCKAALDVTGATVSIYAV